MSTLASAALALARPGGPVRYAAAGVVNSAAGLAVMVLLGALGVGPFAANAAGFLAGLAVSFVLARLWTFAPPRRPGAPIRYGTAFLGCYLLNLAIVAAALALSLPVPIAQAGGVGGYAVAFYLVCRWWVFGDRAVIAADLALARSMAAARPRAALVLAFAPVAALAALAPTPSDVAWQLWIARQLNHGADLYTGIAEVNPPLWFWAAMPIERLATALGMPPVWLLKASLAGLSLASFGLCAALLPRPAGRQLAALAMIGACLTALPAMHFAQREHIVLIGALPYAILAARRAGGGAVPASAALWVGLLAAAGFALKHYFVLVPVLLEAWLIMRRPGLADRFRPETLALGACALAYGAALIALSPDFLTEMVPLVREAYGGYGVPLRDALLTGPAPAAALLAVLAIAWRPARGAPLRLAFEATAVCWLGFHLAYAWQSKGFVYHQMPLIAAALVAAALALSALPPASRRFAALAATASSVAALVVLQGVPHSPRTAFPWDAACVEAGDGVLDLSPVASLSFPEAERRGLSWSSRYLGLWPMITVAQHRAGGDDEAADALRHTLARAVRTDILCQRPRFLLTTDQLPEAFPGFPGALAELSRDPELESLLAAYAPVPSEGSGRMHVLTGALPPVPQGCRTVY